MTACIPSPASPAEIAAWDAASGALCLVCDMSDDAGQGARTFARVALMALILLEGPHSAAAFAYQQADELADACK